MAIPLKYNLRNLRVRWRLTLATSLGIALVVAVFVMVMALSAGMKATYISTGDPRNLLVLRKGSTAESSSQIMRDEIPTIRYTPGIARDENGVPLASAEIIVLLFLDRADGSGGANVLARGLSETGLKLRPAIKITEGRMLRSGLHECVVSRRISQRFANCKVGDSFTAGRVNWTVVGIFDGKGTAYDSEIWMDADETRSVFKRNFYGSVLLRPADGVDTTALATRLEADKNLKVRVLSESKYYEEQTQSADLPRYFANILSVIMSIGAAFSAMNTMYATVGARTREIGTLRVLGFRRREIYITFLIESVLLSLVGGALGCLLALPVNGYATGGMSQVAFTEIAFEFRITPELLGQGMLFALIMGVLGGLLPARVAARKPVLEALKAA